MGTGIDHDEPHGPAPGEQFISEPLTPEAGTADLSAMATGEPGLPAAFTWRGDRYAVTRVIDKWKESGRCTSGSEMYLRKHWYTIETDRNAVMKIYFERRARSASKAGSKQRWWLYTLYRPHSP